MPSSSPLQHQTRRQRRAAAAAASDDDDPFQLAQPDRSGPKGKSLVDLAAERQAALTGVHVSSLTPEHVDFPPSTPASVASSSSPPRYSFAGADVPPAATALLYSLSLAAVHLTLDVAVHHQYAQAIDWRTILARLPAAAVLFAAFVYLLHAPALLLARLPRVREAALLLLAAAAGAYLVRAGNRAPYMAVMRRAPPLGSLLIYCVVEMQLPVALAAVAAIGAYAWWNGYSVM